MEAARKSSPNFCAVVVQQWRCDPPLDDLPGLSGIPPLFSMPLLLLSFSATLLYHKWLLTICDGCFDTLNSSKMRS